MLIKKLMHLNPFFPVNPLSVRAVEVVMLKPQQWTVMQKFTLDQ